jgi:hypothetical protein
MGLSFLSHPGGKAAGRACTAVGRFCRHTLGRIFEQIYKFVGWLFFFGTAELVAVNASLRAKRMAMMMMTSKAKRTKTLKAAELHGDLL